MGWWIRASPAPTPTPTPSSSTHNGSTPASVTPTVFNITQLLAAIAAAPDVSTEASRTVAVAGPANGGSDYVSGGRLVIPSQTRTYPVIVRAANYDDKPLVPVVSQNLAAVEFGGTGTAHPIDITGWTGLEFRGFEFFNDDTAASQSAATYWFVIGGCTNVAFRQCYFRQKARTVLITDPGADTTIANMESWANTVVEDCVFNRISRGFLPTLGSHDHAFTRLSFLRTYNHAYEMSSCSNVAITFNLFDGFQPGYTGGAYINHADSMLGYINGGGSWSNFEYSDNLMIELRDFYRPSFQLENGTASAANAIGIKLNRNQHYGGIDNPLNLISIGGAEAKDNVMRWISTSAEVTSARLKILDTTIDIGANNDTGWFDQGGNTVTGTRPALGANPILDIWDGLSITPAAATAARDAFAALHNLRTQSDIA